MTAPRAPFALWLLAPVLAGCPSSVDTAAVDAQPSKSFLVGKSAAGDTEGQSVEGPPPGVGAPDETNGVCRLFTQGSEAPTCCPRTYGLDVAEVAEVCGYDVFLGEHVYEGCRYSFYDSTSGSTTWIKLALLADRRPFEDVAEDSDKWLKKRKRNEDFRSTPLPGAPSVVYNLVNPVGWALLAGWDRHRQVTWKKGFCGDKFTSMLRRISEAPPVPPDSPGFRRALLPVSRVQTPRASPSPETPTAAPGEPTAPSGAGPRVPSVRQ